MKFKIIMVVFLFSISSFLSIREQENNTLWEKIRNTDAKFEDQYYINLSNSDPDIQYLYEIMIMTADEYNLSLKIERGNFETGIFAAYYYNNLNLIETEFPVISTSDQVDFSNLENDQFYSSKKNSKSNGLLFSYFHSGLSSYEIHNFNQIISNEVRINGGITISGSSAGIADMKARVDSFFGVDTLTIATVSISEEEVVPKDPDVIMIITMILLVLVFLHETSKKAKEIAIRTISGDKRIILYWKLFSPLVFSSLLCYIIWNAVFIWIFIGTYHRLVHGLITGLVSNMLALLGILLFVIVIGIFILSFIPKHSLIKNKTLNSYLYMTSYIIKVLLIVTVLPNFYAITVDTVSNFVEINQLKTAQKDFSHLTQLTGAFMSQDMLTQDLLDLEIEEAQSKLYTYDNSYTFSHISIFENDVGYDIAAIEYDFFELYLSDTLPAIDSNQVTIIRRYENWPIPYQFLQIEGLNIINHTKDFIVSYVGSTSEQLENPILIIYPNDSELKNYHADYSVRNISKSYQETLEIRDKFNKEYEGKLVFGALEEPVRQKIQFLNTIFNKNFLLLLQSILTVIFVIVLGNMTLLATKETESALMLVLGYSNLKRKFFFLSSHILVFILSLYYLLINGLPIAHALLLTFAIILVDYCVISYAFMIEKTNVLRTLKKG